VAFPFNVVVGLVKGAEIIAAIVFFKKLNPPQNTPQYHPEIKATVYKVCLEKKKIERIKVDRSLPEKETGKFFYFFLVLFPPKGTRVARSVLCVLV